MDTALRTALVQHLGELTMDAICSVTRNRELEAENEELRRMVTEERMKVQDLERQLSSERNTTSSLSVSLENAQDALGKARAERAPKPSARRKTSK